MAHKSQVNNLAIFEASPAFQETLHVGRPNSFNRERLTGRLADILDTRWLSNDGPYVHEFERQLAHLVGVRHCIAICNGTVALEIAIRALGLEGEVIVPSFTFIATAHALQWLGITPVFCDVDPLTHNIDPLKVEAAITPRTAGIIGVHVWGRACDVRALKALADRHHLKLIFDAAHALGSSAGGQMTGNFGDAEVFSFHATKFINSAEGGAVMTNDDDLAEKIRLMRNFGFTGYDRVAALGTNGKMSEVNAAMGLTSLEELDHYVTVNCQNYRAYQEGLASVPGVRLITYDEQEHCNYQYVVVEVEPSISGISRDSLVRVLWAENVRARRYFYPGCHRMEPYISRFPTQGHALSVTEELTERTLVLPTGTALGPEQIAVISQVISTAVAHGEKIQRYLSESYSDTLPLEFDRC